MEWTLDTLHCSGENLDWSVLWNSAGFWPVFLAGILAEIPGVDWWIGELSLCPVPLRTFSDIRVESPMIVLVLLTSSLGLS